MVQIESSSYFFDRVVSKPVYRYIDCSGRMWMAFSRWGWGRVRCGREATQVVPETRFFNVQS